MMSRIVCILFFVIKDGELYFCGVKNFYKSLCYFLGMVIKVFGIFYLKKNFWFFVFRGVLSYGFYVYCIFCFLLG